MLSYSPSPFTLSSSPHPLPTFPVISFLYIAYCFDIYSINSWFSEDIS